MSKVTVSQIKLDYLANCVSAKSAVAAPMTLDEMADAVLSINSSAPALQSKSVSYTPSTSAISDTVTPDTGYGALSSVSVSVGAIQTETATVTPTTSSQTITPTAGHFFDEVSVGAVSLQDDKNVTISRSGYTSFTPDSGYTGISAGNILVPVGTYDIGSSATSASVIDVMRSASDKYVNISTGYMDIAKSYRIPATADMTLPSSASSTSSGTSKATITPTSSAQYLNIPTGYNGTAQYYTIASSGGTSKNVQIVQGTTRTNASTLTAVGSALTVSKTGTYDVYWSGFRSNTSASYTWATQLYVGGTAYGSENTTWTNNQQNNHLSNVSLTANQQIRVYGRNTRGTSYYIYAPTLVIVEA